MFGRALLLPLFLLMPTLAEAQPFDLKGDQLGMSLGEFKEKYNRVVKGSVTPAPFCSSDRPGSDISTLLSESWFDKAGVVTCRTNFPFEEREHSGEAPTVAGVPTQILIYHFVDGRLFRITAWFEHENVQQVRAALIAKYGEAGRATPVEVQNRFGAKFKGTDFEWKRSGTSLELVEYFGSLETSSLVFVHDQLDALAESRRPGASTDDL